MLTRFPSSWIRSLHMFHRRNHLFYRLSLISDDLRYCIIYAIFDYVAKNGLRTLLSFLFKNSN
jgi:hypothetical protein